MYEESICYEIMGLCNKSGPVGILCFAVGISSCVEDVLDQIALYCHWYRLSRICILCFAFDLI